MNQHVKVALLRDGAVMPTHGSDAAAGFDLHACTYKRVVVEPGDTAMIPTGLAMEIPPGWCGLILPRSSWAKMGVNTLLPPIDSDYRGEVQILLSNSMDFDLCLHPGDRCAQIVFVPHLTAMRRVEVAELSQTQRGAGGFGSTGGLPKWR
jgi:dUTP pyrophosphatase